MSVVNYVQGVRHAVDTVAMDMKEAIELSYDKNIAGTDIVKGDFLEQLMDIDDEIFHETVNHLFTPINWNKVKLHILWGMKNVTTGNLASLGISEDNKYFVLRDSGGNLDFSPMTCSDRERIREFLSLIRKPELNEDNDSMISGNFDPADANDSGEVEIELKFEGINPMNLEIVEIRVIF